MNDANLAGTLVNILSAVVGGIMLGVLGVVYKSITGIYSTVDALKESTYCIAEHLLERDGFKLPPHLRRKEGSFIISD